MPPRPPSIPPTLPAPAHIPDSAHPTSENRLPLCGVDGWPPHSYPPHHPPQVNTSQSPNGVTPPPCCSAGISHHVRFHELRWRHTNVLNYECDSFLHVSVDQFFYDLLSHIINIGKYEFKAHSIRSEVFSFVVLGSAPSSAMCCFTNLCGVWSDRCEYLWCLETVLPSCWEEMLRARTWLCYHDGSLATQEKAPPCMWCNLVSTWHVQMQLCQ